jgi:hypothetical protein
MVERPSSTDWRPVAPSIRVLLDGTNVFVLATLLDVLAATRIDPASHPSFSPAAARTW